MIWITFISAAAAHLQAYRNEITLLEILLELPYDMQWRPKEHFEELSQELVIFEQDPSLLFNDDVSMNLVLDQIITGYLCEGEFFINRSNLVISKIIAARPPNLIISNLISRAMTDHDLFEIIVHVASARTAVNLHFDHGSCCNLNYLSRAGINRAS